MHAVQFSKDYALQVLDAIRSGKPIPARPDGWTGSNMLMVAGILSGAVFSQGPHNRQVLGLDSAMLAKLHPEEGRLGPFYFVKEDDDIPMAIQPDGGICATTGVMVTAS